VDVEKKRGKLSEPELLPGWGPWHQVLEAGVGLGSPGELGSRGSQEIRSAFA